ncbi:MAG: hypothetical protein U9Q85_04330, partial [Patescibacteria group bacterium]|nr:hypothetical protein [Patescibacteria group bacterium]
MSSQFINYFLTSAKVFFNPSKAKLYKYKNYEEYKKIQIEGNVKKIKNCWVTEENISFLSGY